MESLTIHQFRFFFSLLIALVLCKQTVCQDDSSDTTTINSLIVDDQEETSMSRLEPNDYLRRFGYLTENQGGSGDALAEDAFEEAVREFQRFMNIPETGKLDATTKLWMNKRRCGVKDFDRTEFVDGRREQLESNSRRKRYALNGSKWPRQTISYRVNRYSSNKRKLNKRSTDLIMERAFKTWAEKAGIEFRPKPRGQVDISISFEKGVHCISAPFGRPNNDQTLAHAFQPGHQALSGDIHFNDYYNWSTNDTTGPDGESLYETAVHEIGHSIGLSHSTDKEAVMFPTSNGISKLHADDIRGISELYGKRNSTDEMDGVTVSPIDDGEDGDETTTWATGPIPKAEAGEKRLRGCPRNKARFLRASDCKHYYDCRSGSLVLKRCPGNLVWHHEKRWCDFRWNVGNCKN